jgi:cell division protein FtsB
VTNGGGGSGRFRGRRIGRRLLVLGAIVAGLVFAIQGGEYGTFDLLSQKDRRASLQQDVDSLQKAVDSLIAWKQAILRDPVVQERIAREEFGMVKNEKELLYRFLEPADSGRGRR